MTDQKTNKNSLVRRQGLRFQQRGREPVLQLERRQLAGAGQVRGERDEHLPIRKPARNSPLKHNF